MKKLDKKGFTLIELLAVIVVLAVIMVIATQQVNRTIKKSRTNAFGESYQMLIKPVKTFIASGEDPTCLGTGTNSCLSKYDLSNDYVSLVSDDSSEKRYKIVLSASTVNGSKFKNVSFSKYGNHKKNTYCDKTKIASNIDSCNR